MQDIIIRQAVSGDCDGVTECVNEAYKKYIGRIGRKPAPMLADYLDLIRAGDVYVMIAGARILGVVVLRAENDFLFIENVAVHPLYQGRGLGKRLMGFAEDYAKNCKFHEIRLYTNELMVENMEFYRLLGFEETDRRVDGGYRRVFMRKIF